MLTKWLLISLFVFYMMAVACVESGNEAPSPADAVAQSRRNFAQVESFRTRWTFPPQGDEDFNVSTEAGFESGKLVYASMSVSGDGVHELEFSELLFIDPDLYMHRSDGQWFVLSPWNQGVRPDELSDFDPNDFVVDYDQVAGHLADIEQLDDQTVDDESYLRFIGSADIREVEPDAPSTLEGTLDVQLLLDKDDYLPHTLRIVRIVEDSEFRSETTTVQEFFDFGKALTPPERPAQVRPWRDLQFPDAPCTGEAFETCLPRQSAIEPRGESACLGSGRRVCLLPLGQVSPGLIERLVQHYKTQYGLDVSVMTPQEVPADMADPLRQQIDVVALLDYMFVTFPEAHLDPEAVIVGVTPLDLYDKRSHFRYLFGIKNDFSNPKAVVSSMRMTPEFYGEPVDDELFFSRMRKLVSKYIGLLYYGLPPSEDPRSPMFDSILGPVDLDHMAEPLPIADR
jgi:predicted Zn-dependent protease